MKNFTQIILKSQFFSLFLQRIGDNAKLQTYYLLIRHSN